MKQNPGRGDLEIRGQVIARDHVVLEMFNVDKMKMLDALAMATAGFCADAVVFTYEAWHCDERINPDTRRRWRAGEMQRYVNDHPDQDVVLPALMTILVDRAGELLYSVQQYEVVAPDRVQWIFNPALLETPAQQGGLIPDRLHEMMSVPNVEEAMPEMMFNQVTELLGESQRIFQQEFHTYRQIMQADLVTVMARAPSDDEVGQLWQEFYDQINRDQSD